MDLSPRESVPTAKGSGRKKPLAAYLVLAIAVVVGGVVVTKFLTSAVDYYCNVDEVAIKDGWDPGRTIRIQGVVEKGSVDSTEGSATGVTNFVIEYNGATMPVQLSVQPTGLFQECIPVVVRGIVTDTGDGYVFEGDEVIVKHDNEYDAENADRVEKANEEAAACSRLEG
jgi:cytochrome c-type biogenesis protein CcmE